jgi:DNA-nicking Smr family endonuclease
MRRLPDPFDPLDGPIASTLDLHGVSAAAAPAMVASFLATASRRWPGGLVHVITGRGRGSPGRPVLKPLVKRLLKGELARYARATGSDLDEGGYLIRLKS